MFSHARLLLRPPFSSHARSKTLSFLSKTAHSPPQWRPTADILPLCAAAPSLSTAQRAHAIAVVHGHLPASVSISAALILSYASHLAHPSTLQTLFNQTAPFSRSPFLHNTIIRACTVQSTGPHREWAFRFGFKPYNDLLRDAYLRPDDYTFPFALKLCADFSCVMKGLEVHGRLMKAGFEEDVFVNNTLILFYGACGDLLGAQKVFDEMPERDLISWNTYIRVFSENESRLESCTLFKDMISTSGLSPNVVTVVSVLPVCAGLENDCLVKLIHCYAVKVGLDSEIRIGNALVDAYGKCGNIEALEVAFGEMAEKNEVTWNSIIGGFSYRGFSSNALSYFRSMIGARIKLSTITIATILPTLSELDLFKNCKELHGHCIKMDMDSDVFVSNALIDMYGKWNRFLEASHVFDKLDSRNVVSWNTMIGTCAQNGLEQKALNLLRQMQAQGQIPNSVTITNVLPACARLGSIIHGKEMHVRSIRSGSVHDLYVSNALTDTYTKCGRMDLAQTVFDTSPRDAVSYNILITGYSQTMESSNSLKLLTEMEALGLSLDTISYTGALSACANMSALNEGKQIHAFAIRHLFHERLFVANSLIDMYIKCGRIEIATKVFDRIPKRDTASWNAVILGFAMLGRLDTAFHLFEAMKDDKNVRYDSVSYIAVLSACGHGGLVEKSKTYFKEMLAMGIKPTEMHYACMVDILGRAGLMEEAVGLINGLPIEPGANIWGALLGASRVHGCTDLGFWAAEKLLEIKPDNPGYYVLLSNMYSEGGRWEEADRIRKLMGVRKVKKSPGCSWVEAEDGVHGFVAGGRFDPSLWPAVSG
ncbi:pentatricopeptide repeat-containing protein [Striga asiatica]|uniref:Pentatricopeptide repeat-containing protein n=1 Tax=Striga asiatica TaxID=4170 RepID=A0A5A7Q3A7_STRAF|nr:pentatricopeptide repeat-containing protein [Striga asiatica]